MPEEIEIMIVEDDGAVRDGLRFLINGSEGYKCIAACPSAEEALGVIFPTPATGGVDGH